MEILYLYLVQFDAVYVSMFLGIKPLVEFYGKYDSKTIWLTAVVYST